MNLTAPQTALRPESSLGPEISEGQALEAFDRLRPGERLALALCRGSGEVLARFQAERKGQFDWTPTGDAAGRFQVEVSRRDAGRGALRAVNEALSWDHDRLDDLESQAFVARDRGDFAEAKVRYAVFAFGLRRHIRFEEEILFPAFESRTGLSPSMGPTAVMRDEHREILECLAGIERGIGDASSSLETVRHALHSVLGNHNLKEENIVYPETDRALTPIERNALVARIQAL